MESKRPKSNGMQISRLTRLQRSHLGDVVVAVSKDSTVGAVRFLNGVLQAVEVYIHTQLKNPGLWEVSNHRYGRCIYANCYSNVRISFGT